MRFLLTTVLLIVMTMNAQAQANAPRLPNRSIDWLDRKSHSWNELKGKVVLLNVWTFG